MLCDCHVELTCDSLIAKDSYYKIFGRHGSDKPKIGNTKVSFTYLKHFFEVAMEVPVKSCPSTAFFKTRGSAHVLSYACSIVFNIKRQLEVGRSIAWANPNFSINITNQKIWRGLCLQILRKQESYCRNTNEKSAQNHNLQSFIQFNRPSKNRNKVDIYSFLSARASIII